MPRRADLEIAWPNVLGLGSISWRASVGGCRVVTAVVRPFTDENRVSGYWRPSIRDRIPELSVVSVRVR